MKNKRAAEKWWDDLVEYEREHPIAFASPRALLEARLIADMEKRNGSRNRRRIRVKSRTGGIR